MCDKRLDLKWSVSKTVHLHWNAVQWKIPSKLNNFSYQSINIPSSLPKLLPLNLPFGHYTNSHQNDCHWFMLSLYNMKYKWENGYISKAILIAFVRCFKTDDKLCVEIRQWRIFQLSYSNFGTTNSVFERKTLFRWKLCDYFRGTTFENISNSNYLSHWAEISRCAYIRGRFLR